LFICYKGEEKIASDGGFRQVVDKELAKLITSLSEVDGSGQPQISLSKKPNGL
jgi:hypothetical protein